MINYDLLHDELETCDNMSIPYVIYRLFVDTEMNALVSLIYGELTSKKIINKFIFSYYMRCTETYLIYTTLKKFYDLNIKNKTDWVKNAKRFFPKKLKVLDELFKKWFITQYEERLKHYGIKYGKQDIITSINKI